MKIEGGIEKEGETEKEGEIEKEEEGERRQMNRNESSMCPSKSKTEKIIRWS